MSDVLDMEDPREIDLEARHIEDIPTSENAPDPIGLDKAQIMKVNDETGREVLEFLREHTPLLAGAPEHDLQKYREKLEDDDRLTEEGVEEKIEERRQELESKYLPGKYEDNIPGGGPTHMRNKLHAVMRTALKKIEQTPPVPEPDRNDPRGAAREKEIRDNLASIDSTMDRMERARELIRSGDEEAIRAILDAPAGTSPLSEGQIDELEREAVEARHGEEALQAREDLRRYRQAEQVLDKLEQKLARQVGADQ